MKDFSLETGNPSIFKMRIQNQHIDYPKIVYSLIEVSQHCNIKYEYNVEFDLIEFDRKLSGSMRYPGNYGMIPNTLAEDGDPVDVIMLDEGAEIKPNTLVKLKTLGLLEMVDDGEIDYKILCVSHNNQNFKSLEDVSQQELSAIQDFFKNYKNLDNKKVKIGLWKDLAFTHEYLINKYKNGGRGGS